MQLRHREQNCGFIGVAPVEMCAGDIQCDRDHGAALSCAALQFRKASPGADHRRGEGVQFGFRRVALVARLDVFPKDIQSDAGVPSTKAGQEEFVQLAYVICSDSLICRRPKSGATGKAFARNRMMLSQWMRRLRRQGAERPVSLSPPGVTAHRKQQPAVSFHCGNLKISFHIFQSPVIRIKALRHPMAPAKRFLLPSALVHGVPS